jgi:hypothetical protein
VDQINKPSTPVTVVMWLQMAYLILGLILIAGVIAFAVVRGEMTVGDSLLGVLALAAIVGLGVFAAKSILRGRHWAWWIEILYTAPLVSTALKNIKEFRGFTPLTDPQVFMRETMGEAVGLLVVPFFLATPIICVWMSILWRKREVAFASSMKNE